jgi:hypothetical protein
MTSGLEVLPTVLVCHVAPPSVEYWYVVTGLPPSSPALKYTVISALPVVMLVIVGAVGTVRGVTGEEEADAGLVPTMFTA